MACVDGGGLVVTELSHIKQLVRQLEAHLAGSPELCRHLAAQISSLTDRSIVMITASSAGLASPLSATPTSDVTDGPFIRTNNSRSANKRKRGAAAAEARRHQVRVGSAAAAGGGGGGGDGPVVDDGHSWRKYGQKEILGAKYPRGYYRCTHRHSQGCQATKQVQRSDADPTLVDVVYHGAHTCVQRPPAPSAAAQPQTEPQPERNADARGVLRSLSAGLTVKTEGLLPAPADPHGGWTASASAAAAFGFCPSPAAFPARSASDNWGASPATSGSTHAAAAAPFRPFEADAEVVSALVAAASAPPAPAEDVDVDVAFADELLDFDVSCLFAFDQQV